MRAVLLALLTALLSGVLLVLCLPLGEQSYLAWYALVPLLLATRGRGFVFAFGSSLLAIFFAAWLSSSGVLYSAPAGPKNDAWLYTGFGIFGVSLSLTFGIWGEPARFRPKPWWFAALATLLESVLLLKLPAHLALSQYRNAALVQIASLGGVWLVSFLIWWSNFSIASYLLSEGTLRERARRAARTVCLSAGAILLESAWLPIDGRREMVAALQIADCDEATMRAAQLEAAQTGATLAVWPEFGGLGMAPRGNTATLRKMIGPPFVTSFQDDHTPLPHNVASLFTGGKESPRYAKRKLFGEESKMHVPGESAVAIDGVGLNVCFDSCFPFIMRDTARLGARIVALPTIDPPSTNGFIAAMHASYTPFRAAENGIAIVRADGYAHSMVVDPRGRIAAEAGAGDGVLVSQTVVGPRWTLSKFLGDWWLWFCGLLFFAPSAQRLLRRASEHGSRSKDLVDSPAE